MLAVREGVTLSWIPRPFRAVEGGVGRACRGRNETDNLDSHYSVHVFWPENASVEACQQLCVETAACKGIEFRLGACEIWTLAGGIQASVGAPGRTLYDVRALPIR